MYTAKELVKYSKKLTVLYVEDDDKLREEMASWFGLFFEEITTASHGKEGLQKYNNDSFDIVITDVNMPEMNGVEMIALIKEIDPEQKILAISAHDESQILIELIKVGVSGFILKPIFQNEVINALYPICRDTSAQILNLKLTDELNDKNIELEKKLKEFQTQNNVIDAKHAQIEALLSEKSLQEKGVAKQTLSEYFVKDEDEGLENIVFRADDADDMLEYFYEIPELLSLAVIHSDSKKIQDVSNIFYKVSSILLHYSPYLDTLATSMSELSQSIRENSEAFMDVLVTNNDDMLKLFDAVSQDMNRYIQRFSVESIAMKNSHHIHEPTTLSITQIISMFAPEEFEGSGMDFF